MDLDENTWHTVRPTPRVTGFVGSATSPSPLTEAEVDGTSTACTRRKTPKRRWSSNATSRYASSMPVCEFQRQRGRDRQRSQPVEGFGDDFGPPHRWSWISQALRSWVEEFDTALSGWSQKAALQIREEDLRQEHGKEDSDNHQAPVARGQATPAPPVGPRSARTA